MSVSLSTEVPFDGSILPLLARRVLETKLLSRPAISETELTPPLQEPGATFVTLKKNGRLRGCIGSLQATQPLIEDLRSNTLAAAFRDSRFDPVEASELPELHIEVSLLTSPVPLSYRSQAEALGLIRPGIDGVVLSWRGHRSTYLPQVWEQLPTAEQFLDELKRKAGLSTEFWAPDLELCTYQVQKWSEP